MDDPPGADYDENGIPIRRMTDAKLAAKAALLAPETLSTAPDPRTTLLQAAATPLPPDVPASPPSPPVVTVPSEIEVQHGEGAPESRKLRKVSKIPFTYPGYVP